jgi:hypothetical protein
MRLLPSFLLLSACAPSGIYMITVPYVEGSVDCTSTLDENFSDGFSPDPSDGGGDGPWTETQAYTGADSIAFFHISPTSGGTAVLTWGDGVYPGVAEGDGWTFTWSEHTSGSDELAHEDGYTYSTSFDNVSTTTFHITQPPFADIAGTVSGSSTSQRDYTEDDKWDDADVGYASGRIPSESYLVYKDNGDLYPQINDFETKDCKDTNCTISLSDTCDQAATPFTAKQVSGEDVLLYNDWNNDGQAGTTGGGVDTGF